MAFQLNLRGNMVTVDFGKGLIFAGECLQAKALAFIFLTLLSVCLGSEMELGRRHSVYSSTPQFGSFLIFPFLGHHQIRKVNPENTGATGKHHRLKCSIPTHPDPLPCAQSKMMKTYMRRMRRILSGPNMSSQLAGHIGFRVKTTHL